VTVPDGHRPAADGSTAPFEGFRADPANSVLAMDFDGSLSPIVDDPASAAPVDGAVDTLLGLANRYREVLVVSGRPVSFLAQHLPMEVSMVGLYGLEGVRRGERWEHPNSGAWREVMDDVAVTARSAGPTGMLVEPKGLSITLHYRSAPEIADEVAAFGRAQADRAGLRVRPAKMSVELQPPIDTDKGTVVEEWAAGAGHVLFAGDDVGDLPAFDALDRLARKAVETLRVAVASSEAPTELLERADLTVAGPEELVRFLQQPL
jgi:trehalose 6-phosphate phosphatase